MVCVSVKCGSGWCLAVYVVGCVWLLVSVCVWPSVWHVCVCGRVYLALCVVSVRDGGAVSGCVYLVMCIYFGFLSLFDLRKLRGRQVQLQEPRGLFFCAGKKRAGPCARVKDQGHLRFTVAQGRTLVPNTYTRLAPLTHEAGGVT
jgi:hypothetical protein